MKSTIGLLLLFFFVGCAAEKTEELPEHLAAVENLTVYPANPAPAAEIDLVKEVSFGETDDVFFGLIIEKIAVYPAGRVFIADLTENKIHIYDSNGSYVQSMGRKGQGPGEFRSIYYMGIHEGMLHVYDFNQQRMNVFSTELLEFAYTVSLQFEEERDRDMSIWTASAFYLLNNGNYLMQFVPGLLETTDEDRIRHLPVIPVFLSSEAGYP